MTNLIDKVIDVETDEELDERVGIVPMVVPADDVPGPPQGQWTYEDYAALPDDGKRYEIIKGVLYLMPAPKVRHQDSAFLIAHHLYLYLSKAHLGRMLMSPVDVKLPTNGTVQPDIVVVLKKNEAIINDDNIVGAPDLVIEVSSPGTVGYDRNQKQRDYEEAGVKEYWLVDPATRTVEVLVLKKGSYVSAGVFQGPAKLPSKVLPRFRTQVQQFFAE